MALINKKLVADRKPATYKLDCSTIELVAGYAEFINSPLEHVVNEALLHLFRKDKEFKTWLQANGKADLLPTRPAPGERLGKRPGQTAQRTTPLEIRKKGPDPSNARLG